MFWKCIQAAHCSLGSFIIPFPFVSLCLSLCVCVVYVYVSASDAFCAICILYTMCLECGAYFLAVWLRFIRLVVVVAFFAFTIPLFSLSHSFGYLMCTVHSTTAIPSAFSIAAYILYV